jgi:RNA recognition motif-containing protein
MVKKIYIGNLPFSATEEEVRGLFEAHGEVSSVNLISDRETGRKAAIAALDGTEMGGRNLRVNEARPREGRPGGRG